MDQRCATAHAKLLAGTCPWCGQPVFNGHVISDPRTPSSIDSFFANFADTQIDFAVYKDGLTLKQVVERKGPLDWQRAARYIAEVARQLGEIHRAQQIHGNVRPANIYLGDENSVELGEIAQDFRYASIDEESIPGIVDCLAPEQAVNSTEVDCRADIYSLGCTFYFLLTGHAPFDEGSIAERLLKHQVETPAAIETHRADAPGALSELIPRMLAKKPADRPTASEVSTILEAWIAETDEPPCGSP